MLLNQTYKTIPVMKTSLLVFVLCATVADLYAQSMVNEVVAVNDTFGTAAQVRLTGGFGWYPRLGSSLVLTHRKKRVSLYADYSLTSNKTPQWITNECTSPVGNDLSHMAITMNRVIEQSTHSLRLGTEISLSPKITVGLLVSGFSHQSQTDARYRIQLEQGSNQSIDVGYGLTRTRIDGQMVENRRWRQGLANVSMRHRVSPGQTLTFNFDYLANTDTNPNQYMSRNADEVSAETGMNRLNVDRQTPIRLQVMKVGYVRPTGSQSTLEIGVKASRFTLVNHVDRSQLTATGWQPDGAFGRNDRLEESIGAAYVNLTTRFPEKTTLAVGVRAEYTNSQMQDAQGVALVNRRYGTLLPHLLFTRILADSVQVELAYTRQIARTPFDAVASFNIFWDPMLATGNPALRPTLADNVRASYSAKHFGLVLDYSHQRNPLSRFAPFVNPVDQAIGFGPGNLDRSDVMTLALTVPLALRPWWLTQNKLMAAYGQAFLTLQNKTCRIGQFGGQFNTSHTFRLPHAFTVEMTAWYATPTINEFGRLLSRGDVTVSIHKKLSGNRGALTASISDLFWSSRLRSATDVPELRLANQTTFALNEPRIVSLTYTRNLGKAGIKVNSQRSTASEEERKRVN